MVFATQSLADIANTSIAPAIIESCPQRIFLPNERAVEPQSKGFYEQFGLNDRQVELVAAPCRSGNTICNRGGATGCSNSAWARSRLPSAAHHHPPTNFSSTGSWRKASPNFARRFLAARGLNWAAALLGSDQLLEAAE